MQELLNAIDMYAYNAYGLAMALAAGLSLSIGVWVVVRERARRISLSFLAAAVAMAVYLGGFSFMMGAVAPDAALFWARVAYLGVPFIVPALFHFSMDLLGLSRKRHGWIAAAWGVGLVYVTLAVATDVLFADVVLKSWGYYSDLTAWNAPFLVWSLFLLVLTIRDYRNAYRDADADQRARIRWLAIPLIIAAVGFIDYAPALGLNVPPVGFISMSVFMVAAAWVVARYHLPDLTPAFAAGQILTTMAEPLLVVDRLGGVAICNAAAGRLLGWSEAEVQRESLSTLLGADIAATLLEGPTMKGREMEVEARNGEPIAVAVSTSELVVKGRTVGTVIVARDVRERRRVAERLERREQYFRSLIENARDTITIIDAEGRIRYQSPSHAEVLGRTPGKDVGRSVFERVDPADQDRLKERFATLLANPGGSARCEVRVAHEKGGYRVMDVLANNLLEHPAVRGIVVNGRDVTEERRLADELQQSQKMEAIGRLAGGIAHDFNNILTTIEGNVALMQEEVAEDSELAAGLALVREGAQRAGRLTNQLLAFGRRQLTRPETLDLGRVTRELRPVLERIAGEDNRVAIRAEPGLGRVRVDRSQIEQALVDLTINAREAMGVGGHLEITMDNIEVDEKRTDEAAVDPGSYVRLTVADDGKGMGEATRRRIFEPFFTTKENEMDAGLGLATVYGTVRQANGHIDVVSEPGEGTRFSIYLPRVDVDVGDPEVPDTAVADADEQDGGGEVILVVEDEAPVRQLITKVLERQGYRVLATQDGDEAMEVASAHSGDIDLLIADLVMPGPSGREVAERLKAEDPTMATILISGYTADEVVREGIGRGEYAFVPKPFSPSVLATRVAQVLRSRKPGPR